MLKLELFFKDLAWNKMQMVDETIIPFHGTFVIQRYTQWAEEFKAASQQVSEEEGALIIYHRFLCLCHRSRTWDSS